MKNLKMKELKGRFSMDLFSYFDLKNKYTESEISEMKKLLSNQKVVVIKNVWDKEFIDSIKNYLIKVGKNSIPNYDQILPYAKNFHRLNKTDERAYVKGCFHQFNFFPWNQDYFDLFKAAKSIFQLKNILSDIDKSRFLFLDGKIDENFTARIGFQFYPSGYGYLNKHSDPVSSHQFALPNMIMSKKGDDFQNGGAYFELDGQKVFHEEVCEVGDVVFFDARLPHGVELIDKDKKTDWLKFEGRWMGLFSVNKYANSMAIEDSKELK